MAAAAKNTSIPAPRTDAYFSENVFLEKGYQRRYDRIFDVMERYVDAEAIKGKTVVDLGCGLGGFGRKFLEMGARVIFIDGREDNIADLRADLPGVEAHVMNVETDPFPADLGRADLVLCMGLIYHTANPQEVINKIAGIADNLFLETNCMDHDGLALVWFTEETGPRQFSLSGRACRPSPGWVMQALEDAGFTTARDISHKDADQMPGPGYPGELFSWEFQRTCGWRRDECSLRRLFLASKDAGGGISTIFSRNLNSRRT